MNLPSLRGVFRRIAGITAAVVTTALLSLADVPAASATPAGAASLAAANIGKTAGTRADTPTYNSLGGSQFKAGCTGGPSGGPEYGCADFAKWVRAHSGFHTDGLDASAASFYTYGQNNGSLHTSASYSPQPGDAVVDGSVNDSGFHHVALVTSVNPDGSITTANGDWGGVKGDGSMADFATGSHTASITIAAGQKSVGSEPGNVDTADGYYIAGYTTPVTSGTPYDPTAICGSGFGVVDSHDLGSAVTYLLYNGSTSKNCVTTVAKNPSGPAAMNAALAVRGGSSAADPGTFTHYADPVTPAAANQCVKWGGSCADTSWSSDWSHCG